VKSGFFFTSKRNEIFASISNFASEAKVRAHPSPHPVLLVGTSRKKKQPTPINGPVDIRLWCQTFFKGT
jgi:hypothetical protein